MKKYLLIPLFFLFSFNFVYATIILDPNDPNFLGYPDGNSVFNAQCDNNNDFFYVYFSKTEGIAQSSAIQCPGNGHFNTWQDYYDTYAGIGTTYLLEVSPGIECSSLTYVECQNANNPPPPPPATTTATTTQLFIGGFSYGEIMQTLILLMILILLFFAIIKQWIFGDKVEGRIKIDKTGHI
jgi:hypothetical protein